MFRFTHIVATSLLSPWLMAGVTMAEDGAGQSAVTSNKTISTHDVIRVRLAHDPLSCIELVINRSVWDGLSASRRNAIQLMAKSAVLTNHTARLNAQGEAIEILAANGAIHLQWPHGLLRVLRSAADRMDILAHANVGKNQQAADAETTPLRNPEEFRFDLNLRDIAEVWRRGSVNSSWLLDLTASAPLKDPKLAKFEGWVSDSGEGRWTIKAAIDESVPAPVLSTALYSRFSSRGEAEFADKLNSAMRFEFGGHHEKLASA